MTQPLYVMGRVGFASAEVWQTLSYPFYSAGYTIYPQPCRGQVCKV